MEKYIPKQHRRKASWAIIALLCVASVLWAFLGMDMIGYIQSWIGTLFRTLSGGFIGWLVSRYVIDNDLSAVSDEQRPMAALSQAIVIGAFAIGLAVGV